MTEKGKSAEEEESTATAKQGKKSGSKEERGDDKAPIICMVVYLVAVCSFDVTAG